MKSHKNTKLIANIFKKIATPNRLSILLAIGNGEACVCHLEALLGLRQAYISQQLMDMRDAGLLDTRRDGRYIFYRLTEPQLLYLIIDVGKLFSIPTEELETLLNSNPLPQCCCPDCIAQLKDPTPIAEDPSFKTT
jgi:DNA-binding transcriptional ArsR family regulator